MAKVGAVTVEVTPVLAEGALDAVCAQIEEAVAAAVARGLAFRAATSAERPEDSHNLT